MAASIPASIPMARQLARRLAGPGATPSTRIEADEAMRTLKARRDDPAISTWQKAAYTRVLNELASSLAQDGQRPIDRSHPALSSALSLVDTDEPGRRGRVFIAFFDTRQGTGRARFEIRPERYVLLSALDGRGVEVPARPLEAEELHAFVARALDAVLAAPAHVRGLADARQALKELASHALTPAQAWEHVRLVGFDWSTLSLDFPAPPVGEPAAVPEAEPAEDGADFQAWLVAGGERLLARFTVLSADRVALDLHGPGTGPRAARLLDAAERAALARALDAACATTGDARACDAASLLRRPSPAPR